MGEYKIGDLCNVISLGSKESRKKNSKSLSTGNGDVDALTSQKKKAKESLSFNSELELTSQNPTEKKHAKKKRLRSPSYQKPIEPIASLKNYQNISSKKKANKNKIPDDEIEVAPEISSKGKNHESQSFNSELELTSQNPTEKKHAKKKRLRSPSYQKPIEPIASLKNDQNISSKKKAKKNKIPDDEIEVALEISSKGKNHEKVCELVGQESPGKKSLVQLVKSKYPIVLENELINNDNNENNRIIRKKSRSEKKISNETASEMVCETITKDSSILDELNDASDNEITSTKQRKFERIKTRMENTPSAKDPEAEKRTIFVGNVAFDTNRKKIMKFFSKYGPVETVRIRGIGVEEIGMSKKEAITQNKLHPNRKTVISYVRFNDLDSAEKALSANGEVLNGLHIRVDRALGNSKKEGHSIFIGNLSFEIEEEELWNKFSQCGKIINVRVVRSASTGAGKGFAFVSFETKDGVELALQMNEELLRKRPMRISRTFKKPKLKESKMKSQNSKKDNIGLSFLKQDKPNHLQLKENNFSKKRMMKNYSGSKTGNKRAKSSNPFKKSREKKPRLSMDARRKKFIGKVLTGSS